MSSSLKDSSRFGFSNATETMLLGLASETVEYVRTNFVVRNVSGRGRSVFANKSFQKGDYVIEYKGVCKKYDEADYEAWKRTYESNGELSYCLEFHHQGEKYCVDATREYKYGVARLINHVRNPNLKLFKPLLVDCQGMPRIAMFAAKNIVIGDELFWDYFSSMNPGKCLLNTSLQEAEIPRSLWWIYSYRQRNRGISYRVPNKKRSTRAGLCLICYKFQRKLSCHLIQTHTVNDKIKRMKLIKEGKGRTLSEISKQKTKVGRRALKCQICKKDFLQLSRHLTAVHKLEGEVKKNLMKESRMKKMATELADRKKIFECRQKENL